MKLPQYQLIWLALSAAASASFDPSLYIWNSESDSLSKRDPATIPASLSVARLILAQHLGISDFHNAADTDDTIVLKDFMVKSSPFGGRKAAAPPTAIVFIDGVRAIEDVIPSEFEKQTAKLPLQSSAGVRSNRKLLVDFASQRESTTLSMKPNTAHGSFQSEAESLFGDWNLGIGPIKEWTHIDNKAKTFAAHCVALDSTIRTFGNERHEYTAAANVVKGTISKLFDKARAGDWNVMVAIMPFSIDEGGSAKVDTSSWGTYDIPGQMTLKDGTEEKSAPLERRQVKVVRQDEGVTPPPGILNECYTSKDKCMETTRNCSGHGTCNLKYSYSVGDSNVECFACACSTTKNQNGKTTTWAGPACQKIDVSVPFWLLGGVSLGLVVVIAWAIGLLYSMGQQDLPSVIGAGVAGPRAK